MDRRRSQQPSHGSRPRYRPAGGGVGRKAIAAADLRSAGGDVDPAGRAQLEGNGQRRRRTRSLKVASDSSYDSDYSMDGNSVSVDSLRMSSRKGHGAPMKTLIDEEMSREKEIRRPSPSVIAKLMGLDALPPPQVRKQQKDKGSLQKAPSIGTQKHLSVEDHSLRKSSSEHQEFKDVYEVMDSLKGDKRKSQAVDKGTSYLKRDETDMDFIRQKFLEAKRLSTDETLQNSKEFNDALEVLDSNKDLFLKFLQEPDSLFTKHLNDLKSFSPSPHASNITILKSTKGRKYESNEEHRKSEVKAEKSIHIEKDAIGSLRKPTSSLGSHPLKEQNSSLSHKLLKSQYGGNNETCFHPTRIVLLKPSLEKAQNTARPHSFLGTHEDDKFGHSRHRGFQQSEIQELNAVERERQKLFDNIESMGHKTWGSREIAREITKQMKHSSRSGFSRYIGDGRSYMLSGMSNWSSSDACQRTTDNVDGWNSFYIPLSSYSSESSVNREARKRLSERWKITHRFHEARHVGCGSSTLGEMLSLSDKETAKGTLGSFTIEKASDERLARDEVLGTQCLPSGISSRDGWKDGGSINLPRSMSLPSSSTVFGGSKPRSRRKVGENDNSQMLKDVLNLGSDDCLDKDFHWRGNSSRRSFKYHSLKPHSINSGGEENKLPIREFHVNCNELANEIHVADLDTSLPKLSDSPSADSNQAVENFSVSEPVNERVPLMENEGQLQQPVKDGEYFSDDHDIKIIQETSLDRPQIEAAPSQCDRTELESPTSSKEAEQPSPVSVLDPPSDDDKSSPGCFERVSADLQELRMQLQLLKLESSDAYAEESEPPILSEEDTVGCSSPVQKGEMLLQTFTNDEDRDFSYLLDTLINSGVHLPNWDRSLDTCHSSEHLIKPGLFEKLEKKYGTLMEWSRSERQLLFDLINSILAEILGPSIDLHPWVEPKRRLRPPLGRERLIQETWQMVVGHRKELSGGGREEMILEPRWLDLGDDADIMGKEIEGMLFEGLLEEVVSEFILS